MNAIIILFPNHRIVRHINRDRWRMAEILAIMALIEPRVIDSPPRDYRQKR